MERNQLNTQNQVCRCESRSWTFKGENYWKTHKVKVWTMCISLMHYDCNVKIIKEQEFIELAIDTLDDILERISIDGVKFGLDKIWTEFNDSVNDIALKIRDLHLLYDKEDINVSNIDDYVDKWRKLLKMVLESHAYCK